MSYKRSKILFLHGVFLRDCPKEEPNGDVIEVELYSDDEAPNPTLDDIATDISSIELIKPKKKSPKKYDEMPTQFITDKQWPQKTNLACWNCGLSIEGRPWPAVAVGWGKKLVSEDLKEQSDVSDLNLLSSTTRLKEIEPIDTDGVSCHPCCSMYYTQHSDNPKIGNIDDSKRLFLVVYARMTGNNITHIPDGNPSTKLKKYRGPIGKTPTQFREENKKRLNPFL